MSKDLVDDNTSKINNGHIEREVERRRNFGVFTGTKSRALMIDLLFLTVQEFKDRLTSHYVIDDILKLVRKNGKVQAAAGHHDDSIMSYLIALYVYTYGKNLNRWGIVKGMKEPGFEDNDRSQEEDAYQYAMNNLSEEDMMFFQAQLMASQAANTYEAQMRKEAMYYNQQSELIDKRINATTRVEDVEREDYNYDYDKRNDNIANPYILNEFDDLNDW